MSYEFVRRTLISRLGGSAENRPYVEALTTYFTDLEEKGGKAITYINYPKDGILPFGFSDEEAFEAYDWIDPFKDAKKKPPDYKPPVIKHREATSTGGKEGWHFTMPTFNFDIMWFCIIAVWMGLVAFGGIFIWFLLSGDALFFYITPLWKK